MNRSRAHNLGDWRGSNARSIGLGIAVSLVAHLLILQNWRLDSRPRTEMDRSNTYIEVRLLPESARTPDAEVRELPILAKPVEGARPVESTERPSAVEGSTTSIKRSTRRKSQRNATAMQPEALPQVDAKSAETITLPGSLSDQKSEVQAEPKTGIAGPQDAENNNGDFSERALEQFRRDSRAKSRDGYRSFGNQPQVNFGPPVANKDSIARHFEKHLGVAVDATHLRETVGADGSRLARVQTPFGEYCLNIPSAAEAPRRNEGLRLAVPNTCGR